jgi:hypothetical protein
MLSLFSSVLLILRGLCPRDNNFIKYYELIRFEFHRQPNWNTCTVNNPVSLKPIRIPRTCNDRVWIPSALLVGESVDFMICCTAFDWLSLLDIKYHVGTLWNTCTINNLVSLIPIRIPRTRNGNVSIQSAFVVGESVNFMICCTAFDWLSLLDIEYHVGTLWNTYTINNHVSLMPIRIPRTCNGMVWIQSELFVGESVDFMICCTAFDWLSLLDIDAWLRYWDCNWSW